MYTTKLPTWYVKYRIREEVKNKTIKDVVGECGTKARLNKFAKKNWNKPTQSLNKDTVRIGKQEKKNNGAELTK